MSLITPVGPKPGDPEFQARVLAQHVINVSERLVKDYLEGRDLIWGQNWSGTEQAQACLDALGDNVLPVFSLSAALGEFISATMPGVLNEDQLVAPMDYTIEDGRVILTPGQRYPTEPEVE